MIHNHPNLLASYLMQSRFIDSDGKLMDLSGNGHHGIITPGAGGFTKGPDGRANSAYDFDGANTKIDCGSDFIGTQAVTVSAWIYLVGLGEASLGQIINNGNTYLRVHSVNPHFRFSSNNDISNATTVDNTAVLNTWIHLVVTRTSAGLANFYINGVLSGSANQNSGTPVAGTTNVIIGNNNAQTNTFRGPIASLDIHNAVYGQDFASYQFKKFQQQIQSGRFKGLI